MITSIRMASPPNPHLGYLEELFTKRERREEEMPSEESSVRAAAWREIRDGEFRNGPGRESGLDSGPARLGNRVKVSQP